MVKCPLGWRISVFSESSTSAKRSEMGFRVMLLGNSLVPGSVNYVWGDFIKDEKPKKQTSCSLDLLWCGQMRFKDVDRVYFSDCRMAMLVFETKDRVGYEHIKKWVVKIKALYPNIYIIFTGNKASETGYRAVTADEAKEFAKSYNMYYRETSNFTRTFESLQRNFVL